MILSCSMTIKLDKSHRLKNSKESQEKQLWTLCAFLSKIFNIRNNVAAIRKQNNLNESMERSSSMDSIAAFGPKDQGSNSAWFGLKFKSEIEFSRIIQACSTLASTVTLQLGASL